MAGAGEVRELDLAVSRQALAHKGAEGVADFCGSCAPTRRKETFAVACPGMTVFAPSPV